MLAIQGASLKIIGVSVVEDKLVYGETLMTASADEDIKFSPSEKIFATLSDDGTIYIWDAESFQVTETLPRCN